MARRADAALVAAAAALAALAALPSAALACPAGPHVHHLALREVLGWWRFDPLAVPPIALAGFAYARGLHRLWSHAGRDHGIRRAQARAYAAGIATLLVALVSPLDGLSDILFAAHMSQHELLILVAAPLVVLGRPLYAYLWALPDAPRERVAALVQRPFARRAWRVVTDPFVVLLAHAFALWVWHVPALFEAALADERVHAVQHAMFFFTAALFFWALLHGRYGRAGYGVAVLYVFATASHSGALGALLTVTSQLWYPTHAARAAHWSVDALWDQQLAGLIMWVPTGVLFAVIGLALFAAWIGEAERRALRAESAAVRARGEPVALPAAEDESEPRAAAPAPEAGALPMVTPWNRTRTAPP